VSRLRQLWRENWPLILVGALLLVVYLTLRSSPTEIGSAQAFLASTKLRKSALVRTNPAVRASPSAAGKNRAIQADTAVNHKVTI